MQNFIEIQNIAKFKARLRIEKEAETRNVLMFHIPCGVALGERLGTEHRVSHLRPVCSGRLSSEPYSSDL